MILAKQWLLPTLGHVIAFLYKPPLIKPLKISLKSVLLKVRDCANGGAVWLLLSRHILDIADFKDNKEYITLLVYKNNGKRVYYPFDPPPFIDGVR